MINQLKEMEVVRQQIKREGFESLEYIKDKLEHLNFDDHLGCYVEKNGKPVGLASWVNGAMYGWEEGRNSTPEGFVLMPVEPTDEIVEAIAYSANCCGGIADDIYQAILQTVQKQLPNDQASEKPQSNAFLSAVADMAQKVGSGDYVLVTKGQAKDTERLNFLLGHDAIRTVVKRDIQDEDYQKMGEHYLFAELYWIDGWEYDENSSSQTERGAIDKAMLEASKQ